MSATVVGLALCAGLACTMVPAQGQTGFAEMQPSQSRNLLVPVQSDRGVMLQPGRADRMGRAPDPGGLERKAFPNETYDPKKFPSDAYQPEQFPDNEWQGRQAGEDRPEQFPDSQW